MKRILRKSLARLQAFLLLTVMFVAGGSAWAQDATIVTSSSLSNNGVTISGGTGYFYGFGYVVQNPDNTTISSDKTIVKFILHESNYRSGGEWNVTPAGTTSYSGSDFTWEGSANSISIKNPNSGFYGIDRIDVWFDNGGGAGGGDEEFPKTGVAYSIMNNDCSLYLNVIKDESNYNGYYRSKDVTLRSTAQKLYFTKKSGGYTITTADGLYVGKHPGNTWNMNADYEEIWTIEQVTGGYAFKAASSGKYLGFDAVGNDARAFRDKTISNHGVFTIEEFPASADYTINLVNAPAGASVRVNDDEDFTAAGTYTSDADLDENSIVVTCPESHEYSVDYNEGTHTFTVTFTALPEYTYAITIYPQEKADEFKVMIDGVEYGDTGMDDITLHHLLTESDIDAPEQPGYDGPVVEICSLAANYYLINVTYTALPTLAIGSSATDRDGNYWTSFCFSKPVEFGAGVTPCIVTGTENGKLTIAELEGPASLTTEDKVLNGTHVGSSLGYAHYDHFAINTADVNSPSITTNGYIEGDGTSFHMSVSSNDVVFHAPDGYLITSIVPSYDSYAGYCIEWTDIHQVNGNYTGTGASEVNARFYNADGNSWWNIGNFTITIANKATPVIPANAAVLLKSNAPGAVTYYTRPAGNVDVSANILSASGETGFNVSDDADNLYYKLTLNAAFEAGSAGFYWGVEGGHSINVPAHKAYLMLPASSASNRAAFLFGGDETVTAIESINAEADNTPVFNLQGQRVNATKAGVYVKNGRKVIVK